MGGRRIFLKSLRDTSFNKDLSNELNFAGSILLDSTFKPRPYYCIMIRVSFETSFDSKQPKLEPKLVSALSETKRLFRLFRFYTETESFDVSIEPKQT